MCAVHGMEERIQRQAVVPTAMLLDYVSVPLVLGQTHVVVVIGAVVVFVVVGVFLQGRRGSEFVRGPEAAGLAEQ